MKIPTESDLRSEAKANAFTLEERQVRCEQCCEQAEAAGTVVESPQKHVAALENELTQAVAIAERWRQQAEGATRRADNLLAQLYELTCEHVEMMQAMTKLY